MSDSMKTEFLWNDHMYTQIRLREKTQELVALTSKLSRKAHQCHCNSSPENKKQNKKKANHLRAKQPFNGKLLHTQPKITLFFKHNFINFFLMFYICSNSSLNRIFSSINKTKSQPEKLNNQSVISHTEYTLIDLFKVSQFLPAICPLQHKYRIRA